MLQRVACMRVMREGRRQRLLFGTMKCKRTAVHLFLSKAGVATKAAQGGRATQDDGIKRAFVLEVKLCVEEHLHKTAQKGNGSDCKQGGGGDLQQGQTYT